MVTTGGEIQTSDLAITLCLLLAVLDRIREITSNAHAVAGRVHNFINALSDNVRHVGEFQF